MELSDVIDAYFDCRRHKRNTSNALRFEMDYEAECIKLWEEINSRRYKPGRSIAFVVEYPVKREIFAADFRDRVVHHIIARRIYPLLAGQFITDSYSTQAGKGTLFGIQRVAQHLYDCSSGYTKDCYIMKLDIQGFFMSIDKRRLYDCVERFLRVRYTGNDLSMVLYLLRETIFNRPEKNCIRKVPAQRWEGLPLNKSLFGTDGSRGLPIGNLTSQLLALLYLDEMDHLITGKWGIPYYGRYVDDMVLIHPSKTHLLDIRRRIDEWLCSVGLSLHPRKLYLQHFSKGVLFVGGVIKPGRIYVANRTESRLFSKIYRYNGILSAENPPSFSILAHIRGSVNSYMGMMRHYASQRLFQRTAKRMNPAWYKYFWITHQGQRYKVSIRPPFREMILEDQWVGSEATLNV